MNETKNMSNAEKTFLAIGTGIIAASLAVCGPRKAKALLWVAAAEATVLGGKHLYNKYVDQVKKEDLGDEFVESKVVF